jgi:hypothetical protein
MTQVNVFALDLKRKTRTPALPTWIALANVLSLLIELGQVRNGRFTATLTEASRTHSRARLLVGISARALKCNDL